MDTADFAKAFDDYSDELFRHCMMRVGDRERALELTQEAFLRAMEYAHKGQDIAQMRAFLYRTLRHLIIDEYRRKKSVSLEAIAQAHEVEPEDLLPHDETNTLEAAIDRFDGKVVMAAIKELPDAYAEVVTMRYVEGLSPTEIAEILGESQTAVSVRVHRALKKLRALLAYDA